VADPDKERCVGDAENADRPQQIFSSVPSSGGGQVRTNTVAFDIDRVGSLPRSKHTGAVLASNVRSLMHRR